MGSFLWHWYLCSPACVGLLTASLDPVHVFVSRASSYPPSLSQRNYSKPRNTEKRLLPRDKPTKTCEADLDSSLPESQTTKVGIQTARLECNPAYLLQKVGFLLLHRLISNLSLDLYHNSQRPWHWSSTIVSLLSTLNALGFMAFWILASKELEARHALRN